MTASVLVTGKLFRDPEAKTSGKGNEYAIATVKDGQGDDAVWWRVLAFHAEARDELLTLHNGDSISVSGPMKAEVYTGNGTPRVSLSVTFNRLITAKRVSKRDKEVSTATTTSKPAPRTERPIDDEVPF